MSHTPLFKTGDRVIVNHIDCKFPVGTIHQYGGKDSHHYTVYADSESTGEVPVARIWHEYYIQFLSHFKKP